MKNITKICLCLLCVMSVFLYSSISYAATSQEITLSFPNYSNNVNYISSEAYEENGTFYNYYTYDFKIIPYIQTSADTYKNGYFNIRYTIDNHIPTGCTLVGINFSYDDTYTDTVISFISKNGTAAARQCYVVYYLKNCGLESTIPTGELTCTVTFKAANASWASLNINPTFTAVVGNNHVYANSQPEMLGMAAIIKSAVSEAIQDGELDAIYDYLVLWKTTQDGYLADIEISLHDLELDNDTIIQWLSYINTVQVSQDQKLELIRQLISTFPSYSSQMLNYMQQILNMNASQAAQAASNAAAQATQAQQASQAMAAANDFAKPDIGAMNIDPMDYVSADGFSGVSYILGSILNIPTILSMLLICVTCAFIGYALYGKKG